MNKLLVAITVAVITAGCGPSANEKAPAAPSSRVHELGTIEVTARLVEIPEGAIFKRDLYDYTTVLKYEVEEVHRGELDAKIIYVGQYNPFKPRAAAADNRVKLIGGSLERFVAGQRQRLALDGTVDEQFMGGVVNKYFGQSTDPIHWAVWTDRVE